MDVLPSVRNGASAVLIRDELVLRRKHIYVAMYIVFVDLSRFYRVSPITQRVCAEIDTQHDCILIDLKMSVDKVHAKYILGIMASEEFSEGLQLIRGNFRLLTVIVQVVVPVLEIQDQPRARLRL